MSQVISYTNIPGGGTVNSVSGGQNITITGTATNPVVNVSGIIPILNGGTYASSYSTVDGTVYYDGTRLVTTATGTSGFVLTSAGPGVAPSYQAVSASGAVTSVSGGNNITITGTSTAPIVNVSGTTNHALQVGNASASLTSLSVGATNTVLLGNTGANPSFGTVPNAALANSSVTLSNGNNITVTGSPLSLGGTASFNLTGTTNHAVQIGNATNSLTSIAVGTTGQVLGGNTGADPSWQSISSLGGITTITGNTGGAISPTAGNINIVTANSTVKFAGAGSTETLDFGLTTNLLLGSSGAISTGVANTSLGQTALSLINTGSFNTALGWAALNQFTSGAGTSGGNTSVGYQSLAVLTTGTTNTALGTSTGAALLTGVSNVLIGNGSGSSYTGSESSNIVISSTGVNAENNAIHLGTQGSGTGQQNSCFIAGITGVNVGSVASVVSIATGTGQLGSTTITAGTNISIVPGANTITINGTGAASFSWSIITANQTAAVNRGYFCNKAGTLALALPAVSAVGDIIEVVNINTATGTQFTQAASQQIFFAGTNTTLGAGGTLTSSAVGDTLKIVCETANLVWYVTSSIGNWTVV